MYNEFYAGVALVVLLLALMAVLVFSGRATAERFHRDGARPYARKDRTDHRG